MEELRNEKEQEFQLAFDFLDESPIGLCARWLPYPYHPIDLHASLLHSCAKKLRECCRNDDQALQVLSVLREMYDDRKLVSRY